MNKNALWILLPVVALITAGCGPGGDGSEKLELPKSTTTQQKAGAPKGNSGVADTAAVAAPPGVNTGTPGG